MKDRTKRLSKIGNAVVPQISEWIGRRILKLETERHLNRCDEEQNLLRESGDEIANPPTWLTAMGEADWEAERYLILKEAEDR
jgi:hypothetical protein